MPKSLACVYDTHKDCAKEDCECKCHEKKD